jgi:hypothetical protein
MSERFDDLVRNLPVADFYYKGSHSHPIRRRVLVTDSTRTHLTGFELREGNTTRDVDEAPIKTFLKEKIATRGECRTDSNARKVGKKRLAESTLIRLSLSNSGVV